MLLARNGQKFQSTAPYRHKARESQHDIMKGAGIVGNVVNILIFALAVALLVVCQIICARYIFNENLFHSLNLIYVKSNFKTFTFHPVTHVSKIIFKVNVPVLIRNKFAFQFS